MNVCPYATVRQMFGPHICGDAIDITGREILAGSWRDKSALQVWDFGTGKLIEDVNFGAAGGEAPCKLYTARLGKTRCKGLVFAGGSGSNEVRAVNRRTGNCVARVAGRDGHHATIRSQCTRPSPWPGII